MTKALWMFCLASKEIFDLKKHLLQETIVVKPQPASKYHTVACSLSPPRPPPSETGRRIRKEVCIFNQKWQGERLFFIQYFFFFFELFNSLSLQSNPCVPLQQFNFIILYFGFDRHNVDSFIPVGAAVLWKTLEGKWCMNSWEGCHDCPWWPKSGI